MFLSRCNRGTSRLISTTHIKHRLITTTQCLRNEFTSNAVKAARVDYATKYAEKLQKKAVEEGLSVDELKDRAKKLEKAKRKLEAATKENRPPASIASKAPSSSPSNTVTPSIDLQSRKDSSPVKPLGTILNLDKLLETPHTAEQISLLWRAYHTSRSGGTGRGFLCASIPVDTYEKMLSVAQRYPSFLLPLPRDSSSAAQDQSEASDQRPHEFYFMEWGMHGSPLESRRSSIDALFDKPQTNPSTTANPQTSTVLFTPLGEYKLRNSFATPYLVLTNYTDLARSHGIVLLRGEITPSSGGTGDASYLLSQQDAQLLVMGLQKFYLWSGAEGAREALLRTFHENPTDFKWEELLKHTDFSA
ncbi:hypothetical protein EIP86_009833 [Pleurotus ostreatoroseus]|nr:hypothetical protein EIP86_009833 [Pleurotus ostreatoroseus]